MTSEDKGLIAKAIKAVGKSDVAAALQAKNGQVLGLDAELVKKFILKLCDKAEEDDNKKILALFAGSAGIANSLTRNRDDKASATLIEFIQKLKGFDEFLIKDRAGIRDDVSMSLVRAAFSVIAYIMGKEEGAIKHLGPVPEFVAFAAKQSIVNPQGTSSKPEVAAIIASQKPLSDGLVKLRADTTIITKVIVVVEKMA